MSLLNMCPFIRLLFKKDFGTQYETSWDGLFTAMPAPGLVSLSKKIQSNYKGLKITMCMPVGAKYRQDTKRSKTQLPLLKSLEQK